MCQHLGDTAQHPQTSDGHCQLLHFICVLLGNCSLMCMCTYDMVYSQHLFFSTWQCYQFSPFRVFLSVEYFVDHSVPSLLSPQNGYGLLSTRIQGLPLRSMFTCYS